MIFATFYEDLLSRLEELKDASNKPLLKHIDLWNRQTEYEEDGEEDPIRYDAAFIEFMDCSFQTLGRRKQSADIVFRIHAVSQVLTETKNSKSKDIRSRSLAHLKLNDAIFDHLQNFSGEYFTSIIRTGFTSDHNHTGVLHHISTFSTRMEDTSAMKKFIKVEPTANITVKKATQE